MPGKKISGGDVYLAPKSIFPFGCTLRLSKHPTKVS